MLQLILGTDWVQIRKAILEKLREDVLREQGGRILMVPELISHDTERRLCVVAGDTASRFAEVLSFSRLAGRVSDAVGVALERCMDAGGRVVAMASAARQLSSQLKAYGALETKPEFLTGLVDAVDEFKRCCISARDLKLASEQTQGSLAQKLEELSLLLNSYDGLCSQGLRDPRDQMTWLLEQLTECDFGENHVFYIDGFPDFTRQHLAILEHLIQVSPQVTVGLNCDRADSSGLAFEKAGDTASMLLRCAQNAGVPVKVQVLPNREDDLGKICRSLFQGAIPQELNENRLSVFRADTAFTEAYCTAQQIQKLVRGGCRYRDISVVCSDMAAYQNIISMAFHRCGVPFYQSGTEDILQKSVVGTVLSALDAALDGFEQRQVLRYLRSALSPLDPDTCDEVENYAILWGIRGNRWTQSWTNHPEGLVDLWTREDELCLARLEQARALAMEPLQRLEAGFREAKDLSGQVAALYAFLEELQLADRLEQLANELEETGDYRSAQILDQLWEILLSALEQLHDVLGNTVWEPENFDRLLKLLLSQYDVGTIPPVLDAVTVGPVSAMRCQQPDYLFVLGAQEGALPGYGGSAGILSDQERTALRDLGVPLTGGAVEGLQAEFAEIYGVFCGARKHITVSCPGEQPSYLYQRLAKMAGSEGNWTDHVGAAPYSPQEAGAWLARWDAKAEAKKLGVEAWYDRTKKQAEYDMGKVDPTQIRSLYGDSLNLSASQVDRQAQCQMSYFLKYGLRAKERKEATVDPAEFGTYVHAVLEQTARDVMARGGFHQVPLEECMDIALAHADRYTQEHFKQIDSQRFTYLFRRNRRELEMVVQELWQELKNSKFQPAAFELAFGGSGQMDAIAIPSRTMAAVLRGFVDRVDLWKEQGKTYFRVVDYKTGRKDFDYCDVFNGVGLQMLLYLFALQRSGSHVVGPAAEAAGIQYFPARVPLVSADSRLSAEEAELLRQKEWKRKGLLLLDEQVLEAMEPGENPTRLSCTRKKDGSVSGDLATREQLLLLEKYVFDVLGDMVEQIASGDVTPNPYTRGTSHDACAYCPYGAVCHQATVEGRRNYKAMSSQRFWEDVEKEVQRRGG